MSFKDQHIIITGGSSGIGLELAKQISQQGGTVGLIARRAELLQSAAQTIRETTHSTCLAVPTDVRDVAQVQEAVEKIRKEFGAIDMLINAAGVAHPGYVQDLDLEIFQWMMEVNFFGTVHMTKAVLPEMIARRQGTIVNIASLAAVIGLFGYTAYGASKFAVRGFTDALRAELKPLGVKVFIVLPPDTDTPQLAYENQFKPAELKLLFPELGVVSPQVVARSILRGIQKGRYVIIPDFGSRIIYRLISLFGDGVYPVVDFLVRRAKRKMTQLKRTS